MATNAQIILLSKVNAFTALAHGAMVIILCNFSIALFC